MRWYIPMACSHAAVLYAHQREIFVEFFITMLVFGDTSKQVNQKQGSRSFCTHKFHAISESK